MYPDWKVGATGRSLAALAILLAGQPMLSPGAAAQGGTPEPPSLGAELYDGAAPLTGRISGHHAPMPPPLIACVRCHAASSDSVSGAAIGPDLRGGWLTQFRSRRGGPPAQYDQPAFCRALRQGIDPVSMLLTIRMPRFDISDADCAALWLYLKGLS